MAARPQDRAAPFVALASSVAMSESYAIEGRGLTKVYGGDGKFVAISAPCPVLVVPSSAPKVVDVAA